ncbi:ABC transporter permease [Amycolatopsis pithecellobii]|uniref:ABC transporter permease n=1 Tax=Amycolatopsis pithecellobii TaxID=664692 RepID=A0A6N7Z3H3_9PSEU|nr:ABC transporter permease [Amycolatopsis pithecellobii]MTD54690.1 ABC transporter permease [Amycolatopsis pithecellobii]
MSQSTETESTTVGAVSNQRGYADIRGRIWNSSRRARPVLVVDIVLIAVFAITQPMFLDGDNLINLLVGTSVLAVISIGQTFVLLSGAADLSVAAIATLSGYLLGKALDAGLPGWSAVVLMLVFGTALGGLVNGFLVGRLRLSFLVVTLASMTAFTGVVNLWSDTKSVFVTSGLVDAVARDDVLGIPAPIWVTAVVVLVAAYIQNFTMYGRDVYAVGGNEAAARLSGIRVERVVIGVFAGAGLCSAIGGLLLVGQIGVASPTVDPALPLMAIAAVFLGGASLAGGAGGVGGTVLGVVFIGVLQNGLSLAGIPSFWQQVLTGAILVLAVFGDRLSGGRMLMRRSRQSRKESS